MLSGLFSSFVVHADSEPSNKDEDISKNDSDASKEEGQDEAAGGKDEAEEEEPEDVSFNPFRAFIMHQSFSDV